MSDTAKRLVVGLIALALLGMLLLAAVLWLGSSIACEDAEEHAFDTVRCDDERGVWWVRLQVVLYLGTGAAALACVVWGLVKPTVWPPAVAAAVSVPVLIAVVAIQGIELGEAPQPRISGVRAGDCAVPCASGVPVSFRLDRKADVDFNLGPARFEDIGGRQHASGVVGQPIEPGRQPVDFEGGTHTARVTGRIVNPPGQRGPLPPGDYEMELEVRPQNSGNQRGSRRVSVPVVIRPR